MVENAAYALPRRSIPSDILAAITDDLALSVLECLVDPERLTLGETVGKGSCKGYKLTSYTKTIVFVCRFIIGMQVAEMNLKNVPESNALMFVRGLTSHIT